MSACDTINPSSSTPSFYYIIKNNVHSLNIELPEWLCVPFHALQPDIGKHNLMLCTILSLKSYNMWTWLTNGCEFDGVKLHTWGVYQFKSYTQNVCIISRPFNIVRIHTEWLRFLALWMQTMHCNRIFVGAPFYWGWTNALWVTLFDIIWQYIIQFCSLLFVYETERYYYLPLVPTHTHTQTQTNKTKAHRAGVVSMDTSTRMAHLSPSQ